DGTAVLPHSLPPRRSSDLARCVRRDDSFSKRTTFISAFKPASSSSINFVPKYATDMVKKAFSCLSSVNKSIGRYVKDVSDYFFQYQRIKRFPKVFIY